MFARVSRAAFCPASMEHLYQMRHVELFDTKTSVWLFHDSINFCSLSLSDQRKMQVKGPEPRSDVTLLWALWKERDHKKNVGEDHGFSCYIQYDMHNSWTAPHVLGKHFDNYRTNVQELCALLRLSKHIGLRIWCKHSSEKMFSVLKVKNCPSATLCLQHIFRECCCICGRSLWCDTCCVTVSVQ